MLEPKSNYVKRKIELLRFALDMTAMPKSNYVKRKIKDLKFTKKNREYIRDLIAIEEWVLLSGVKSRLFWDVMDNYIIAHENDCKRIMKELKLKAIEEFRKGKSEIEKRLKDKKESKRFVDNCLLKEDKSLWKKFGGRL